MTVDIDAPLGFRGRVVDSSGNPVFTSEMVQNSLELTFYPAPYAAVPQPSMPQTSLVLKEVCEVYQEEEEDPQPPLEPDQIGYRLEIFPQEGTDLEQSYSITITLTSQSALIYLPIVRR